MGSDPNDLPSVLHDLRSTLAAIVNFAELVRADLEKVAEAHGIPADDATLSAALEDTAALAAAADRALERVRPDPAP